MEKIRILDKTFRKMIPHKAIVDAVKKVAARLNEEYASREEPPVLLCTLNGAIPFTAELMKHLDFDPQLVSVRIKSYSGTQSTGHVTAGGITADNLEGRDVIICEDIVDTGHSIDFLRSYLKERKVKSAAVCCLLFKPGKYLYDTPVEFKAMEIPNDFIVGFGLDYNEYGRKYEDIYVLDE